MMMTGVLNYAIHNKPRRRNKCDVWQHLVLSTYLWYLTAFMESSWPWTYSRWIYNYICNQCLSPLKLRVRTPFMARWRVLDTPLCDKVCQWLTTSRWFSPDTPVSSTNKTDRHDITEILLKVALKTINQLNQPTSFYGRTKLIQKSMPVSSYWLKTRDVARIMEKYRHKLFWIRVWATQRGPCDEASRKLTGYTTERVTFLIILEVLLTTWNSNYLFFFFLTT